MSKYTEVACPHCLARQQVANKCVACKKIIILPLNDVIQYQIQKAYNLTGRNAKAAALLLGIPYRTFWYRIKEFSAGKEWSSKAVGHLVSNRK